MKEIFALVDCNNFYVSCEKAFSPALQGKPVIVLSNNDGCVVARSNEVKALGVPMGIAAFKIRGLIEKNNIEIFSSNYSLYADMSSRVMHALSYFTPQIEVYSIDEAFLNLAGFGSDLACYGRKIKNTVLKWTGIPVSIGIAQTKTLAKVANKIAKTSPEAAGVFDLTNPAIIDDTLKTIEVEKVWGVGIKSAIKLKRAGVRTALQLKNADITWIRKTFGVCGVRTVYELRNIACYGLEDNPPARQSIVVSRSFGKPVETIDELKEALAAFAARAGEKLREENLFANVLTAFAMTNRFDPKTRYFNSRAVFFPQATHYTPHLISAALSAAEIIYRPASRFKKAGVLLSGLVDGKNIQRNLFDSTDTPKTERLMHTVDRVNILYPDSGLKWAAEGLNQSWQVKFSRRSPRYTTIWSEIPSVA